MKERIAKPLTVAKDEFSEQLVQLCNDSGLPFFLIEYMLKELIDKVHAVSIQQLEADRKAYQKALESATESEHTPQP